MRYLTLQTVTWATVATAVASAVWLAVAGGVPSPATDPGARLACAVKACTEPANRAPMAQAPAKAR